MRAILCSLRSLLFKNKKGNALGSDQTYATVRNRYRPHGRHDGRAGPHRGAAGVGQGVVNVGRGGVHVLDQFGGGARNVLDLKGRFSLRLLTWREERTLVGGRHN